VTSEEVAPTRTRSQGIWGLLDQLLASVSSFLVLVVAARSLTQTNFGAFSMAFEVMVFSTFVVRGLGSDPLSSAHASDSPGELREAARAGASTVMTVAAGVGLILIVLSQFLNGALSGVLLSLGLVLPGFALQDFLRYVLLVQGRARAMFINDLSWVIFMLPLLLLATSRSDSAWAVVVAWGLAGNLSALLGVLQTRNGFGSPRAVRAWLARHRELWPYFLMDNFVFQSSVLVMVIVLSIATSLAQVGALRATMPVFAPISVLGRGIFGIAVPALAHRRTTPKVLRRDALLIAGVLGPMTLIYAAGTLLVPDSVGRIFLGDSWKGAQPLLLLAGVTTAAGMISIGAAVGLRAFGAARDGLTARMVVTMLALIAAITGAVLDGAHGIFVALAISASFEVTTWVGLLNRATRRAIASQQATD